MRLCFQDRGLVCCLFLVLRVLSLFYKVSQCFDKRKRSKDWEMEHISSLVSLLLVWTGLSLAHNYLSDKVTFIISCTFNPYFHLTSVIHTGACEQDESVRCQSWGHDKFWKLSCLREPFHWILRLGEPEPPVQRGECHHHRQDRVRQIQLQT